VSVGRGAGAASAGTASITTRVAASAAGRVLGVAGGTESCTMSARRRGLGARRVRIIISIIKCLVCVCVCVSVISFFFFSLSLYPFVFVLFF